MGQLQFLSLASGSSGNCFYLGDDHTGIMIDAGIPVKSIRKALKDHNIPFERLSAIFITHDHADHIRSVGTLGEVYYLPIYSTAAIHDGINKSYSVTEKLYSAKRIITKYSTITLNKFKITPFEVPHDGTDNVGYLVEYDDMKIAFATDLGHISKTVSDYISRANYLIIESNYDEEMLRCGNYPHYLKERIRSANGHMSNRGTAEWLASNYQDHFKHIFLCHLSKDNNHPELAFKTVESALAEKGISIGIDVRLTSLRRNNCSDLIEFI